MRTVLTHGICFIILIVINFLDPPVTPPPTPPPTIDCATDKTVPSPFDCSQKDCCAGYKSETANAGISCICKKCKVNGNLCYGSGECCSGFCTAGNTHTGHGEGSCT